MRVLIAGATGAVGRPLVARLVAGGHSVIGMTRSGARAADLRAAGADAVVADPLDRDAVIAAVTAAGPEIVVHQLTALPTKLHFRRIERDLALTNRLRTEGTDHLIAGARAAGARRLVWQSYTGWPNVREGGPVKTEDDPLDPDPPRAMRAALDAIRHLEAAVVGADGMEGVVLRYGSFYGPGTGLGALVDDVHARRVPVVGDGGGVWSFLHIDDAADATQVAIEGTATGVFNIVDDEPAPVREWLPHLAATLGAPPPRRVPVWIARILVGEAGVSFMTRIRGSSNARATAVLGWRPAHPTWRSGFADALVERPARDRAAISG